MSESVVDHLILGHSLAVRRLRALITRVAPTELPILIHGPTGAGKELVAQAVHLLSRRTGPLVSFNVCAINEAMFEDALFGHVRGAFTNAISDTRGLLREANHGTIFLDEMSGLLLPLQAKLLRALETKQFRPVGAVRDERSDFRVVTATNDDLDALVEAGRFRRDLLHRLRGAEIHVPPLRDRLDDVPVLVAHFLQAVQPHTGRVSFGSGALDALQDYHWPGNVRELRLVIERLVAVSLGPAISKADVLAAVRHGERRTATPWRAAITEVSDRHMIRVLDDVNWNLTKAARALGVDRGTVHRRLRRLGITRAERRSSDRERPAVHAVSDEHGGEESSHLSAERIAETPPTRDPRLPALSTPFEVPCRRMSSESA